MVPSLVTEAVGKIVSVASPGRYAVRRDVVQDGCRTVTRLRLLVIGLFCAIALIGEPTRIVSTSPSITETLFALGLGSRVVGVSTYCRFPPEVKSLPKIGTYLKPDAEKIALLHPDLVIIYGTATVMRERMQGLGIPSIEVDIGSLTEIYSMIEDIGRAAGVSARAGALKRDIHFRLEAIRRESEPQSRPTVLLLLGRNPGLLTGLIAAGPGTYLGQLLEIAGGRNALPGSAIDYPHISLETVERLNPDVILDASQMGDTTSELAPQETRLRKDWLANPELKAVRSGRVFGVLSESLVTPGPRVIEAVELLRDRLRAKGNGH